MPDCKVLLAGDTALIVQFGESVDLDVSRKVLSLARRLGDLHVPGVIETVPTIRSLMVYYEPLCLPTTKLQDLVLGLAQQLPVSEASGRTWEVPVCYDPELAPDLADVAARTSLSPARVVELHSGVMYHVYMLGFLPGLAYLGDLPEVLALPRRENPRPKIAAGSVGIGGPMTCIYPMETPCGWHLIGRSPVPLWDLRRENGALLSPGDRVRLMPVSLREFEHGLSDGMRAVRQITGEAAA